MTSSFPASNRLISTASSRLSTAVTFGWKRRTVSAPTPYQANQKVARSAISRGYEPALVFEALKWEEGEE